MPRHLPLPLAQAPLASGRFQLPPSKKRLDPRLLRSGLARENRLIALEVRKSAMPRQVQKNRYYRKDRTAESMESLFVGWALREKWRENTPEG